LLTSHSQWTTLVPLSSYILLDGAIFIRIIRIIMDVKQPLERIHHTFKWLSRPINRIILYSVWTLNIVAQLFQLENHSMITYIT